MPDDMARSSQSGFGFNRVQETLLLGWSFLTKAVAIWKLSREARLEPNDFTRDSPVRASLCNVASWAAYPALKGRVRAFQLIL